MNVYDKAYELARAIRDSLEAKEIKEIRSKIEADPETKRMLDDFREKQMNLQKQMLSGQQPEQQEMEKLDKLYEVVSLNPLIKKLFEAERRFGVMIDDVQKILADPMKDILEGK